MIPPQWVVDELQRAHKWVRLGWLGFEKKKGEESLNKGTFVLLQLYHKSDAEKTVSAFWNDAGPVYGKPYDRLLRVPVRVARVTPEEVFSGAVIQKLKHWMTPISERVRQSALEKGKEYERQVKDIAGQQGEFLYWKANRNPEGGQDRTRTKDDVTEEDKAVLRGERMKDLTTAFMPPPGSVV